MSVAVRLVGSGAGALLLALGLWLLWSGRRPRFVPLDDQPLPPTSPSPLVRLRDRFTLPTRMALGLSIALVGYHTIVYVNPRARVLHVPLEHAWILAVGIVITVLASLGADRLADR